MNLAVDFAVNSVMDFSGSFEPSKTGYNGPEKFAPKFAQEFALKFAPPRGKIRTGFALQDTGAKTLTALTEVLGRDIRANDPRDVRPKNFLFGLIFPSLIAFEDFPCQRLPGQPAFVT